MSQEAGTLPQAKAKEAVAPPAAKDSHPSLPTIPPLPPYNVNAAERMVDNMDSQESMSDLAIPPCTAGVKFKTLHLYPKSELVFNK